MKEKLKERSVLSLRKKVAVKLIVAILVASSVGLGGSMFFNKSETNSFDQESLLDTLDLPQRAPYRGSPGVLTGGTSNDEFGHSVSYAGYFNDDNAVDLVVGAPYAGSGNKGEVYVFLGGTGGDGNPTTADLTITGVASNSNFGHSVAGGGDFNDDGKDDIIVGCPDFDEGATPKEYRGKIYVFLGTTTTGTVSASTAFYTYTGEGTYDWLGWSVAYAGDFDNDGYDDFIAGAPGYDDSHIQNVRAGRAYLILGDSSSASVGLYKFTGEGDSYDNLADFGWSVSYAGNVDNSGPNDVLVGAPDFSLATTYDVGRAYIFPGTTSPADKSASDIDVTKLTGDNTGDMLGYSVSFAGDIDGDSNDDDVIVGAPGWDDGQSVNKGRAFIFKGTITAGSTKSASDADVTMTGESDGEMFGNSVSTAGDYNKDNYDDVIVGAYLEDSFGSSGTDAGRAHIYYGGSTMNNQVDVSMTGEAGSDHFGFNVSAAGDFNDDGYDDVIVGAPKNDAQATNAGRAYVYSFVDHVESAAGGTLGYSVSSAGKFNSDNYVDVVVGNPYYDFLSTGPWGRAYVFHGGSPMDSTADVTLMSEQEDSQFGLSVASGDFDNDGYGDILVGAPGYDNGMTQDVGRVYIYFGNDPHPSTFDVTITGDNAGDQLGYSVSSAGKWDQGPPPIGNDNYDDILIGAPGYSSSTGRAYLFYGRSTWSSSYTAGGASVTFLAHTNDGKFGYSLAGLGDMNADGDDDLVISSPKYSSDKGRVYLYLGDDSDPNTEEATYTGENNNDQFGYSVSSAGQMDGDSKYDIIVGAPKYSSSKGRAYVFLGTASPTGDTSGSSATLKMDGESTSDEFGFSVSVAGDVNNDNYDDVAVGAPYNDATGTNAGRVYIFYGGSTLNDRDEVLVTGEYANSAGERKGWAVANAGDVNNDNYDDVIMGAPYRMGLLSPRIPEGRMEIWGDPA